MLLFLHPHGTRTLLRDPKNVGGLLEEDPDTWYPGVPMLRLRMLPGAAPCCVTSTSPCLSPKLGVSRRNGSGNGLAWCPQDPCRVPLRCRWLWGAGAASLVMQTGKARGLSVIGRLVYHAWKEPTAAVFSGSGGGAAGRFVGGIKSLAPKLLKQGWRALCLQGPGWVLACVWLMHANSKSPCNKLNKAGDSNVKANEITPRLGVWGDKGYG